MSKGSDWTFAPRDEDAEEDPHTVMHVYEGDGGVIIRDGGNISTFGVRSRAVMAAFDAASEEPAFEHSVIAGIAARLAKAERELDEAKAEIERMTPRYVAYDYLESPARREMAEARVSELERALEEAERVIKPFADVAREISDETGVPEYALSDNRFVSMTLGECRAARKWMEERHD